MTADRQTDPGARARGPLLAAKAAERGSAYPDELVERGSAYPVAERGSAYPADEERPMTLPPRPRLSLRVGFAGRKDLDNAAQGISLALLDDAGQSANAGSILTRPDHCSACDTR